MKELQTLVNYANLIKCINYDDECVHIITKNTRLCISMDTNEIHIQEIDKYGDIVDVCTKNVSCNEL